MKSGGGVVRGLTGAGKSSAASKIGGAISFGQLPLIMSGGVITDADRLLGIQGDALPLGSGYGVWESTTNLSPFSGGPSMASLFQGTSLTIDTTHVLFPGALNDHMKLVTPGITFGGGGEGLSCHVNARSVATNLTTYTASYWVYSVAGGEQISIGIDEFIAAAYQTTVGTTNYTLVAGWNRIIATGTTNVVGITHVGGQIRTRAVAQAITIWVVGQQMEAKSIATPLVRTSGSTASRTPGRIQASADLLAAVNTTQLTIAVRVMMGIPSSNVSPNTNAALFSLNDGTNNNRLECVWATTLHQWQTRRLFAGGGTNAGSINDTFNPNDKRTVIMKYDAASQAMSLAGAAFASMGGGGVIPFTEFDLGSGFGGAGGSSALNGTLISVLILANPISDTDASTINGYGDTFPDIRSLPNTWGAIGLWHGKSLLVDFIAKGRAAKSVTVAKKAGAIVSTKPGGTRKQFNGKFGGARTELWAGVISHRVLAVKTGGLKNAVVAGGTYRALKPHTGGGKSALLAGTSKKLALVHTGGAISSLIEGAIRNTARQKAGGGISTLHSGGVRRTLPSKTGGLKSAGHPGSTYKKLTVHTGGGKSVLIAGATKLSHHYYIKIGGGTSTLHAGILKTWRTLKTGGGRALLSGGAVEKHFGPPMTPGSGILGPYMPLSAVEEVPELFSTVEHVPVVLDASVEEAQVEEVIVKRPDLLKVRV